MKKSRKFHIFHSLLNVHKTAGPGDAPSRRLIASHNKTMQCSKQNNEKTVKTKERQGLEKPAAVSVRQQLYCINMCI